MSRLPFLAIVVALVLAGLLLRLVPWGLPLAVRHYGGGVLWAAMVFACVAGLRPKTWGRVNCIAAAGLVALAVEVSRLWHTPGLDAFRRTLPGQLLVGHIYSGWNILAYALGIAATATATWRFKTWSLKTWCL